MVASTLAAVIAVMAQSVACKELVHCQSRFASSALVATILAAFVRTLSCCHGTVYFAHQYQGLVTRQP